MRPIGYVSIRLCVVLLLSTGPLALSQPTPQAPNAAKGFEAEVLATTMTQIVVQWKGEPASTASFELERAADSAFTAHVKSYPLDKGTFLFSDTDRPPVSKSRFTGSAGEPLLDPNTGYYYRVKANLSEGGSRYSNTVNARVSGPVRGQAGDLWADVVLGKPDFGTNATYRPNKYGAAYPGGVLIDKTVKPNRMFIADCNNNRILGFKGTSPHDGADIVLGQPNFESGGGNGDSCAQLYPYRAPSSAGTLCLTLPTQISMGETIVQVNMAIDEKGNLYVPDIFNNRVLRYNDPFGTDTVADDVWGQGDFAGNEQNRGSKKPANNSFNFGDDHGGVALDQQGNLWVADSGNHRVLRFPKNPQTSVIAKDADVVLGQPDFSSNGDSGYKRTMAQLWHPADVELDGKGRLYVCDGISNNYDGRILIFEPPFVSGAAASRKMPIPSELDISFDPAWKQSVLVGSMVRDINPDRMWFEKRTFTSELVDLGSGKSVTSVWCAQSSGIDVDSDGNLYTVSKWSGVYRHPGKDWSLPWSQRQKLVEKVLVQNNAPTADSTGGILGITILNDQLVIAENSRMLIWNKFDVNKVKSGQAADDVYGEKDFSTILFRQYYASPQVDTSGRLWVCRRQGGHTLLAFSYPLTRDSQPIKTIPLLRDQENVLPVVGGGAMHAVGADFLDFAVVGTGDKIWVADRNASRVFRINNVDGREDPGSGPYVDIVLGQNNLTQTERNQGQAAVGPRGLASSYNVDVSPLGELVIADNGGEVGSDRRIIIYDAARFPDKPAKCLFANDIGDPNRVIGTGGRFDIAGYETAVTDPMCSPFEVGISSRGTLVAGMNGYSGQRFPLVYLDPKRTTEPQMALGDFTAYPTNCFIDKDGNVYMGDWDWSRVLIYKKPFEKIRY